MEWVWNWGGECFGYRTDDRLFAYYGLQIGRFYEDEVYAADGRYLGEIRNKNRLITNVSKKNRRRSRFAPMRSGAYDRYANYAGYAMYAGYEDFPSPEDFR